MSNARRLPNCHHVPGPETASQRKWTFLMTITRQLEMGSLLNFAVLILYKASSMQIKIILAALQSKNTQVLIISLIKIGTIT